MLLKLIHSPEEYQNVFSNSAFKWGQGVFTTVCVHQNQPVWLKNHLERLLKGLDLLGWKDKYNISTEILAQSITADLNHKQKTPLLHLYYRYRFTLFEACGQLCAYSDVSLIQSPPNLDVLPIAKYAVYNTDVILPSRFTEVKTCNRLIYTLAHEYILKHYHAEALLINTQNRLVGAHNANIFWLKAQHLYTPPTTEGALEGITRKNIIRLAQHSGISVIQKPLSFEDLCDADFAFTTNAIQLIKIIAQIRLPSGQVHTLPTQYQHFEAIMCLLSNLQQSIFCK